MVFDFVRKIDLIDAGGLMCKVSVITVCLNEERYIAKTLDSVLLQQGVDIELIVIDGGSVDSTNNIVERYRKSIAFYVTGPDRGIFDAMNKGLKAATGDWIVFMNAGDLFASNTAIANLLAQLRIGSKVVYGNKNTESGSQKPYSLTKIREGIIPFCHQAALYSMSLGDGLLKFREDYVIYGDYEVVARIYRKLGNVFQYVDTDVCISRPGGVSSVVSVRKRLEKYRALYAYFGLAGVLRGVWSRLIWRFR